MSLIDATTTTRRPHARRLLAAAAAGVLLSAVPAGAALADPKPLPGEVSTLTCPGGEYSVVLTESNGNWTPAFDTESTRVFQPVGFKDIYFKITAADGSIIVEETESGQQLKNGERKGQNIVTCTFKSTFSFPDEQGETVYGESGGTVLAVWRD